MMLIACPYCGPRSQEEFRCGGEAHIDRPLEPERVSDTTWARYLYRRKNTLGTEFERWQHLYGCGQWFHAARNTVTHEILRVYGINEQAPEDVE